MEYIASVQNPKVKEWAKLHSRKEREKKGCFIVEGVRLVEEALKTGNVEHILLEEGKDLPEELKEILDDGHVVRVSTAVMEKIGDTETPQGIAAIVKMEKEGYIPQEPFLLLLLDRIQDPGNLGTLIRTADAAGFHGVALGEGCVDPYNGKAIRASMGSLFHLPVYQVVAENYLHELRQKVPHVSIVGTSLKESKPYDQISYKDSAVLIIGNEGSGVSPNLLSLTDHNVVIPIYGKAESLNAGIAGSILMYEAVRQRKLHD
ncbi:MAG TPA: RNA methyltransferase [Paenibacillaceae bacterium]|nr:RNA methyltransferase [Paenibacillaceae bacterium]